MSHDNPSSEGRGLEKRHELSSEGRDALQKLETTLAAQGLPKDERDEFTARFIREISGETNSVVINTILGKLLLESLKRARALKQGGGISTPINSAREQMETNFCSNCGAPIASTAAKFCTGCGQKLAR